MDPRDDVSAGKSALRESSGSGEESEPISDAAFDELLEIFEGHEHLALPLSELHGEPTPSAHWTSGAPSAGTSQHADAGPDPASGSPPNGSGGCPSTLFQSAISTETELAGRQPLIGENDAGSSGGFLINSAERYESGDEMGRGGMGVVFRAWDKNLSRWVAMKVLRLPDEPRKPGAQSRRWQMLDRFFREAKITGQLTHPGVVPVYELGRDEDGDVFFTMRIVSGTRLDEVFRLAHEEQDGWSQTRVLNVLIRVCDTLAYAHARGVIHRDLKPANIMVGKFGETYVMDWGAAKLVGEKEDRCPAEIATWLSAGPESEPVEPDAGMRTVFGQVLGTPPYMPPEQADGQIDHLDERSDVYSIGAMLYELLAGAPPYLRKDPPKSSRRLVQAICAGPPAPVGELNPKAPSELVAICEKAMARRQGDRYRTMADLAEDLRCFLENRVVRAHRTGALAELRKWFRRNRGVAFASIAAGLIALGGLLAIIVTQSRANEDLRQANEQERLARQEEWQARRNREGLNLAWQSATALEANPTLGLLLAVEAYRRNPDEVVRRALYSALQPERESATLLGHTSRIRCAAFSPDGERLVSGADDGVAALWDTHTGRREALLLGHDAPVLSAAFSPDGSLVVTTSIDHTARVWSADTGVQIYALHDHQDEVCHVAFSSDGRYLATSSKDRTVRVYDARTGQPHGQPLAHDWSVRSAAFHPLDSRIVATANLGGEALLWDLTETRKLAVLGGHAGGISSLQFSSDGSRILTAAGQPKDYRVVEREGRDHVRSEAANDPAVRLWTCELTALLQDSETEPATLAPLFVLRDSGSDADPRPAPVMTGVLSEDGRHILAGRTDGSVLLWDLADDRPVARKLPGHAQAVRHVAFGPDGQRILTAAGDGTAKVWNLHSGNLLATLKGHSGDLAAAAFANRGHRVLTASGDELRLWSTAGVKPLLLPGETGELEVAFNPSTDPAAAGLLLTLPASSSRAHLWNIYRNELVAELAHDGQLAGSVASFSRDGKRLATMTRKGRFSVWNGIDGTRIALSPPEGPFYRDVTLSADGASLVAVSGPEDSAVVDLWNLEPLTRLRSHPLEDGQTATILHHTSSVVLATSFLEDKTMTLLDLRTGASLPVEGFGFGLSKYALASPDGTRLVTYDANGHPLFHLWDRLNRERIPIDPASAHREMLRRAAFSPDSSRFFTLSKREVKIWQASSGELEWDVPFEGEVRSGDFSPDGSRLVIASPDPGASALCFPDTRQIITELGGKKDLRIRDVTFAPDGRRFVARLFDRDECALFEATSGRLIASLGEHRGPLACPPQFSSDGKWIATADEDGTVLFWPADLDGVIATAVPRPLTPDEIEQFKVGTDNERYAYRLAWHLDWHLRELHLIRKAARNKAGDPRKVLVHCERTLRQLAELPPPAPGSDAMQKDALRIPPQLPVADQPDDSSLFAAIDRHLAPIVSELESARAGIQADPSVDNPYLTK